MANYVVSDTSLGSVADAIRTKGGTSAPLEYPQGFIDAIGDIQTGGTPTIQALTVTENGTYTAPSGVDGYSPVTVNVSGGGDTPIPDDGKTRIFISIAEGTPDNRLTFYLRFTASTANNTTVDWGDGTTETLGSTTATNYSHKYSQGGDYIITMTVNTGTISFVGSSGSSGNSIYGERTSTSANYINRARIKKIIFGEKVSSIGSYACNYCVALESVIIQDKNTFIDTGAFMSCAALLSINIPDNITALGEYIFDECPALTSLTIPKDVISIGRQAFYGCRAMSEYHFKPTTPPTLANSNAFSNIPSDCIIYVPYSEDHSILNAYKTATNYGGQASKMQEEPT